jgi:hypothetical protein
MDWKMLLACVTGSVDEELLLRNEYLVTENRILRKQIEGRVELTDAERQTLAEIGKKLGKQALEEIATIVKPDTILAWHRKLIAKKFDGSKQCRSLGRPRNVIPFPTRQAANDHEGPIGCSKRLGGLLKYDERQAA